MKVVKSLDDYPLRTFLEKGVIATINSDDPAYFGGYVGDNYYELSIKLNLTK